MFVWCELGANMVASIARKQGFWVIELELEVQKVNHKYKWGYYKSTFEFVKEKYSKVFTHANKLAIENRWENLMKLLDHIHENSTVA